MLMDVLLVGGTAFLASLFGGAISAVLVLQFIDYDVEELEQPQIEPWDYN